MITPLGPTAWRHAGGLKALAVSPDGRLVAGGGEDLRLWSAEDGALVRCLEWPRGFVHRLAWSADGGRLAAAHGEELDVWSVEGARLWRGALDVAALVADTDGGFLVAAAGERGVSVRRLRADFTSQRIGRIEGKATAVALSVEGGRVAVAHGGERAGEIDLHELPGLGLVRTLTGPAEHVYELSRIDHWEQPYIDRRTEKVSLAALAFDASGATLVSGGNESVIRWWSVARGELLGSVELGDREVGALVFDRAGRTVAITHDPLVGGPCAARLWEPASGALRLLPGRHQRVAAFSGDGARVLVGGSGQRLQTFRTGDGAAIAQFFRQLEPNDMPVGGTATARAIERAREILARDTRAKGHARVIVLVTDGEDLEGDPVVAARAAAADGTRVDVVQIGGRAPEVIPDVGPDGRVVGPRRDESGKPLVTQLSAAGEAQLESIAREGGGVLIRAERGQTGIDKIARNLSRSVKEELSERVETVYGEAYTTPLALALLLLLAEVVIFETPRRRRSPRSDDGKKKPAPSVDAPVQPRAEVTS